VATGGEDGGAGIGGGDDGAGGSITIDGGTVTATGGDYGAGIGGGSSGDGGAITISGGTVTATGGMSGAGIGGGIYGEGGDITIDQQAHVTARGGKADGDGDGGGAGVGSGGTDDTTAWPAGEITIDRRFGATLSATGGQGDTYAGKGANIGEGGFDGKDGAGDTSFTNPTNQMAPSGNPATLTCGVTLQRAPNVSYGWSLSTDGGATYTAVSGATTSSLNVTADPAHNNDLYVCGILSKAGDMETNGEVLYLSPPAQVTVGLPGGATAAVPTLNPAALALLALVLTAGAGLGLRHRKQ
jgi:hypothetical protein